MTTTFRIAPARLAPALLALAGPVVQAHEGHGLPGASHWHAEDALLFLALALVVGLAIWWRGRE